MKKLVQAILLASFAAVGVACEDPAAPEPEGTFAGTWANKAWDGVGAAYLVGNVLHVAGTRMSPAGIPAEFVSVEITSPAVGTFSVAPGKAAFVEMIGGDVYGSVYRTTPDAVGSVTITRYDRSAGIVEGSITFEAELLQGTGSYGPRNRLDAQFSAPVRQLLD